MFTTHPVLGDSTNTTPVASWPLRPESLSASRARRLVAWQLSDWGLGSLTATVRLLVSETVTNAVRHAPGPIRLSLYRYPIALRCEVEDTSPRAPHHSPARDEAENGRGLELLDALTDSWGSDPTRDGKIVWFELALRGTSPAE
ncbi:ATP-binding protein [Streptomyces malaysiensis]|uniref:ATP-binding protein n=1 Tax=Streptomyces malaysiensis TaxID=92644 RepID=UPI00371A09B1